MMDAPNRQAEQIIGRLDNLKFLSVGISRALRDRPGRRSEPPGAVIGRALTALFLAHGKGNNAIETAEERYPGDRDVLEVLRDLRGFLARAVTNPATTTAPGWAAELAATQNFGAIPLLAPQSTYAALASRGLRVNFEGVGAVRVPYRGTAQIAGVFVGEGQPIPVKPMALSAATLKPYSAKVISLFSGEIAKYSTPTIESIIRLGMAEDTGDAIDGLLLSATAGTANAPGGILNGLTPITATAGGGTAALASDLGKLAAAIPNAADLVYLMNEADRVRALVLAPGLMAATILSAPGLPAKRVVAIDAADFVSGEGDEPAFDVSSQAVVVARDDPGAAVASAPTRSLYQENLLGIRGIFDVSWGLRRPNRVAYTEAVTW